MALAADLATIEAFADDVASGLSASPKTLPSKYLYDAEGSRLFDQITELDAYYPTRTEESILRDRVDEMTAAIGSHAALFEYGSGSSVKTRVILDAFHRSTHRLSCYVPIDISGEHLAGTAHDLMDAYPGLPVLPVAADYTQDFDLPNLPADTARRVVFFPGSTIGNFTESESDDFFEHVVEVVGPGGALLLGADQAKDLNILQRAYDDEEGVTAGFNLNLLVRINRELEGTFDLASWRHEARWNAEWRRMEMHLVSLADQSASVGGKTFNFRAGETIHTENSAKYSADELAERAAAAGLTRTHRWTDARGWFAVELFTVT